MLLVEMFKSLLFRSDLVLPVFSLIICVHSALVMFVTLPSVGVTVALLFAAVAAAAAAVVFNEFLFVKLLFMFCLSSDSERLSLLFELLPSHPLLLVLLFMPWSIEPVNVLFKCPLAK